MQDVEKVLIKKKQDLLRRDIAASADLLWNDVRLPAWLHGCCNAPPPLVLHRLRHEFHCRLL